MLMFVGTVCPLKFLCLLGHAVSSYTHARNFSSARRFTVCMRVRVLYVRRISVY